MKLCYNEVIYIRTIEKLQFGSEDMTVLYWNPCYSEGCYNEVDLYKQISLTVKEMPLKDGKE